MKHFYESKIAQSIEPDQNVIDGITALENAIYHEDIIDEAVETMTIASYHITYKKNGSDVLMVRPSKEDWSIKLYGSGWNVKALSGLTVLFEYEISPLGWYLTGMADETKENITAGILKSGRSSENESIILFPLTVLSGYFCKNPLFFKSPDENIFKQVMSHFWEGRIKEIQEIYDSFFGGERSRLPEFLEKWYGKINTVDRFRAEQLTDSMKLSEDSAQKVFFHLEMLIKQSIKKYKNSLNNIWDRKELMSDQKEFQKEMEDIRKNLLMSEDFEEDLLSLKNEFSPRSNDIIEKERATNTIDQKPVEVTVTKNNDYSDEKTHKEYKDWFDFLIKSKSLSASEIPFQTKQDFTGEQSYTIFTINQSRLKSLSE
ncbi:hypothetical protein [Peribacillus kribbensis]|uniref:hypothetical protein n=1 Tax=Peribacillus kribbensis TaxID=356658 RepID=UPI000428D03F|nr:hypothetical protein [Peribacillus kribbensis]